MQQTRAVVSLGAVCRNAAFFKARAGGAKLCAVVTADGYVHGAAQVAAALRDTADLFAVSLVSEGAALRLAGVAEDILVLTPPLCEEEALRGLYYGLIFTAGDAADCALLARAGRAYGEPPRCHLKCNTGMNRYGTDAPSFAALCAAAEKGCRVEGVYSHFYRPEHAPTREAQFALFRKAADGAETRFGRLVRHIAATGGTLAGGYEQDMVRIGIGLYGYLPQGFALPRDTLAPAMRVFATVAAEHAYLSGGAGYGAHTPAGVRLYTLRYGYADGFRRESGPFPLCMDASVREGDAKKYEELPVLTDADACAAACDTIPYEVLVNAGRRAVKIYEG